MGDDSVWYFAYGAMMSPDVVRRRGIEVIAAERAVLSAHALVFDIPGVWIVEPAFASIQERAGADVHGMLYRLTSAAMECLDGYEGPEYRALEIEAKGVESGTVSARAYQTIAPVAGLRPSRRYLGVLCTAARARGLPDAYIAELERHPSTYIPVLSEMGRVGLGVAERVIRASNERKRRRSKIGA